MGKRKPWCERAKNRQAEETVKEKDVWKLSPRMFWGGMLQIMSITICISVWITIAMLYLWPNESLKDVAHTPGFWEVAWPTFAIGTGLGIAMFLISLVFTLPGKAKMKRALIPIRCQVCPKCFYDLSARPRNIDTCPECGTTAPRRECVRLWCKLLRSRF